MRFPLPAMIAVCALSSAAVAQQQEVMPFQLQLPKREGGVYTTKNPAVPPGQRALPEKIPFGRASPDALIPVPTGPRTTESAPVPNVDSMEAAEPVYSDMVVQELPEAVQDPSKTTTQTGTVFEGKDVPVRPVEIRALNKVTGHSTVMVLQPGGEEIFGNLTIHAHVCRAAVENTQPDFAALIDISEQKPDEKTPQALFSGWMFASSPSLTGLEHPIYDISIVKCKKAEKTSEKTTPSS